MFADVIIGLSIDKLDRSFTYKIPEAFSEKGEELIGVRVIVPFGKGGREVTAYIIRVKEKTEIEESLLKEILRVDESGVPVEKDLIKLAGFIREQFGGTMNEALKTVVQIPKTVERKKRRKILIADREKIETFLPLFEKKGFRAKAGILKAALFHDGFLYEDYIKEKNVSIKVFEGLEAEGFIRIEKEFLYRKPIRTESAVKKDIVLNEEQKEAVRKVTSAFCEKDTKKYLLFGVTGSGKTEVYMEIMEEVIRKGKQVIFLIPEISLTFQMVKRLSMRFGDRISIMNSRMSKGERFDQYLRALEGEIDIIVGPRSALFTPFSNLGLIIVDEEHSDSYKSSLTPRYSAREVAIKRAELAKADIILGSATPSLSAVSLVNSGAFKLLSLTKRPEGVKLPEVEIIDLREELKAGNRSIFSERLRSLMLDRLAKKEQIMLFINRRGYAGFVSCRSCGEVIHCPNCDVSLTFHKPDRLLCHYCGHEKKMPKVCPTCTSPFIKTFGLGTEQVEEQLKNTFPEARVLRMDKDTTGGKHSHEEILKAFGEKEAEILVGTQMIINGHDFPNVTLMGILAADLSLYSNDFRSAERTYQLLVQAAGRAGRGETAGKVVIQTYKPEHYAIEAAACGNYKEFYEREFRFRRLASYPPFVTMMEIHMSGADSTHLFEMACLLKRDLTVFDQKNIEIKEPVWDVVPKINNVYKMIIHIKADRKEKLIRIKEFVEDEGLTEKYKKVSIQFDFPT